MKAILRMLPILLLTLMLTACGGPDPGEPTPAEWYPSLDDYILEELHSSFEWQGKGYAIVSDVRDSYRGVVDGDGNLVVSCEYYGLDYVGEGILRVVTPAQHVSDRRMFYMDLKEHILGAANWKNAEWFHEGMAVVSDGLYGYVNTAGELAVDCVWDEARSFSDGLGVVRKDRLYGAVDASGKQVIPCEWDSLSGFEDGLAFASKNGRYGFIDKTGAVVIPLEWESASAFSEGLAAVEKDGRYGYIDRTGKLVIPCEWKNASAFSEGLARVSDGSKYGYIDQTGKLVIPCEWENTVRFSKGLSSVYDGKFWGYIDRTGKLVVPCEWKGVSVFPESGLAIINSPRTIYANSDKYGVMDTTGTVVVPCDYTVYGVWITDEYIMYRKGSGYGACNARGEEIVLAKYDSIVYAGGRFFMIKDRKLVIMDTKGNTIV